MANVAALSLIFIIFAIVSALDLVSVKGQVNGQKTWCVAKPSSDEGSLMANINYACSEVDCSVIMSGCNCFSPDNLFNHASVAMNLYYQCKGRNHWNCYFNNSALIVFTDPSYGDCKYE